MTEIVPDGKDWTWTLTRPCPDCGFAAGSVPGDDIAGLARAFAGPWAQVLARPNVGYRPAPAVWSALEYACHVRDVYRLFDQRARLMLTEDDPRFADWDQDAAALEGSYTDQDPTVVAAELAAAAETFARTYDRVAQDQWDRPGIRSNGSLFTVRTLGQYALHDLRHHLWDVSA